MFKRRQIEFKLVYGLQPYEIEQLATYNAEVERGLVHTDEWKQRMARLKRTYIERRELESHREFEDMINRTGA